ncbi:outer membrane protein transport protein [bacterium]|nr:outer membrane protein transport protein [bacterium]
MKNKKITVLLCTLAASQANAFTFSDQGYGAKFSTYNARSLALGSTQIASDYTPTSLTKNPALLGIGKNYKFSLGSNFTGVAERRSMPIYDSFDSRTVETTVAKNNNVYYNPYFALSLAHDFGFGRLGLGIGYFPVYSFDYNYEEPIRNNDPFSKTTRDVIIARATRKMEGTLNAWNFGISENYGKISFGGTVQVYGSKKLKFQEKLLDVTGGKNISNDQIIDVQDYDLQVTDKLKNTPVGLNFGAFYEVNERISVGAYFQTSVEFKFKNDRIYFASEGIGTDTLSIEQILEISGNQNVKINSSYAYKTPKSFGAGIAFRPRNEFNGKIYFDVDYTNWKSIGTDTTFTGESERNLYRSTSLYQTINLDSSLAPTGKFQDTWEFRFGVEYIFENGLPVRFGFNYAPTYVFKDVIYTNVSVGTGWEFGNLSLDFAIALGSVDYQQNHLFSPELYYKNPVQQQKTVRVKDSVLKTLLTASYGF